MPNSLLLPLAAAVLAGIPNADPKATAILETALARMGGRVALEAVSQARVEAITEWERTALDERLSVPVSSYEWQTELRDYALPAWRYTRRFNTGRGWREIVDVVTDSVAVFRSNDAWAGLSVAYVDERNELFAYAPERVLLLARAALDARALPDTTLLGVRYTRVTVTITGHPTMLFFRGNDGFLSMARFRAAQLRDFGLAGWGEMAVEFRYSRWARLAQSSLTLPAQIDIYRVGRPYKRISVLSFDINPGVPVDSFFVSDSLRNMFFATQNRAMYDVPMAPATITDGRVASFTFGSGGPIGAVRLGDEWLFLEGGTAPLTIERAAAALQSSVPGAKIAGVLATASLGYGGYCALAQHNWHLWVTRGAKPYVDAALGGCAKVLAKPKVTAIPDDQWIKFADDSLRVESVELPDYSGATIVYAPSLHWAYSSAFGSAQQPLIAAHIRQRGWTVDRIGSLSAMPGVPVPPGI